MNKLQKIDTISIIIITGFSLAVFYHYVLGTYLGLSYPYNTFLFRPDDKFMDFFNMLSSPYINGKLYITQFPFGQRLAQAFTILPSKVAFAVFIVIFLTFFLYVNYSNLSSSVKGQSIKNVFVFSFLTYPFLFVADRANIEVFVFIFLYLFILFYRKQRTIISIIFLSCAISMKLFPAVFLVLLLSDKKYKEAIYTVLLVTIISICGYLSYDGGLLQNIGDHLTALSGYNKNYATGNEGLYFGSSIWGLIKAILIAIGLNYFAPLLAKIHSIAVFMLFGLVALYIIFLEKNFWKKVALLVLSMNLFPFVSGDYKLIHIFIPLFLFINSDDSGKFDFLYCILFGLLIIPKAYFHYPSNPEITSSVIINPLLMSSFMIFLVGEGLGDWAEQNTEKFKKIKKQSLYALGGALIVFSMLVIGGIWFLLSPSGNDIVKTQITTYLSKKFSTAVKFDTLRFSTERIIIDLDIRSVAKVQLALLMKTNTLSGDYRLNVEDASKFSKRFGEKLGFSTHGKITGTGINNINIDGNAEVLQGAGNYHIELINRKISRLRFDLKDVRTDDALKFIRKNGDGLIGTMDINGDVSLENRKPKNGYIILSGKNLTVKDPSTISEFTGLLLPKNANIDIKTKSDIKDDEMVSKIEVRAKEARLTIQENRINLNTRKVNSDFIIEMNNVKDFAIGDNARFGFINQSLPGLKKFKSLLDKNYKGKVVVSGHFTKDGNKLAMDGIVLNAPRMKNNDFIDKILPFRMQDGVLNCSTCK